MKTVTSKLLTILAVILIAGFGTTAFAYRGMEKGGGGCPFYSSGNLTEDQVQKLNAERKAYSESVEPLRKALDEKESRLWNELSGANTDKEKLAALQKEISEIRAQLDRKEIDHFIKVKEINPEWSRGQNPAVGCNRGYGRGGCGARCTW